MSESFMGWLFGVLLIIGFAVVRTLLPARKQKRAPVTYCRVADMERTRRLYQMAEEKLWKTGLQELMLKDFRFQTVLNDADLKDMKTAQKKFRMMLGELLPYLHLGPDVRLVVTDNPSLLKTDALGQYDHSPYKTVSMLVNPSVCADAATLVSALCHECTHCFMYTYLLNDPDRQLNEGLTDTMASLIGFSKIMLQAKLNRKLPYLIHPEFEELRRCLLKTRDGLNKQAEQTKDLENAKAKLKKDLAGASAMVEQAHAMIAVNKTPKTQKLSKSAMARLQASLLSLESGDYEEKLRKAAQAPMENLSAVRQTDESVLAICRELHELMQVF